MSYYVYILASRSRNLYVGVANNLFRRLAEHRDGRVKFTSRYRITRLVHVEEAARPVDAIAREKQIKAWARAKRLALIESDNRLGMTCSHLQQVQIPRYARDDIPMQIPRYARDDIPTQIRRFAQDDIPMQIPRYVRDDTR